MGDENSEPSSSSSPQLVIMRRTEGFQEGGEGKGLETKPAHCKFTCDARNGGGILLEHCLGCMGKETAKSLRAHIADNVPCERRAASWCKMLLLSRCEPAYNAPERCVPKEWRSMFHRFARGGKEVVASPIDIKGEDPEQYT